MTAEGRRRRVRAVVPIGPMHSSWRGPAAMTAAMAFFAVNDALVKFFGATLPVSQTMTVRGAVATVATLIVVFALSGSKKVLLDSIDPIVLARGLCETFAIFCLIFALTRLPLGDVTAISQMAPLFVLPLAAFVYSERIGAARWMLVLLGFLGVALTAKPGRAGFDPAILVPVLTAAAFAVRDLLAGRIRKDISALAVALSTLAIVALISALVMLVRGVEPLTITQFLGLGAAGLLLAFGQGFIYLAFRLASVSDVAPFNYTKTLFGLVVGAIVFSERPDILTLIGAALIVASGVGVALLAASRGR